MKRTKDRRRRILLAQAEWPARALLAAQLEASGHEVVGAESVEETLALASTRPIDLLIVDTAGLTLDQAICLLAALTGRPAIALTGTPGPTPSELAAAGFDRVLARPLRVAEVVAAASAVGGRNPRRDKG